MDRQTEIHFEIRDMKNNRRAKMLEYMKEFDKAYEEKREQLINECEAIGHKSTGAFHDNGWGVTWRYCDYCGAAFDKVDHNEQESKA